ncbi:D-glycero-beta-D-manno-heptose 1,7-bisphosphate 7-phosphatase [Emticicia sp. C21]|uniref:D-glycero-alpha-D-manno-heptose-1,7-bisphosphate 7-phosphatase n=1 Tax=Emticicia sp. C21 TaxID=2302915 RepID=UPI000E349B98|nr:HAD family hydrolase [Emticicia sp. C21]RFS17539.1 HAD family hydrolase [Emticicia sp. C21]
MNKAVFFDKDGTLIKDVPYNIDPLLVELEKGVIESLRRLQQMDYQLVIISNQSGIALGFFSEQNFLRLKDYLLKLFEIEGVVFGGFYYCPHHPNGKNSNYNKTCDCRKPAPGLLLQAAKELDIDLNASWMVGDILHDVEAGNQAGCRSILINNGNETEWDLTVIRTPTHIATDLSEVTDYILNS